MENLFRSLPYGFSQKLVARQGTPLLRPGMKMIEVDGTGTLVARADWKRLVPTFEVHRPNGQAETIQWGVFRYYNHGDPDGFRPSTEVWGPRGTQGSQIMAQLEVDQSCELAVGIPPRCQLAQHPASLRPPSDQSAISMTPLRHAHRPDDTIRPFHVPAAGLRLTRLFGAASGVRSNIPVTSASAG